MARFQPGNNGGPGRPKGSKNKFQEQFWRDLQAAWESSGSDAITRVIADDPATFLKVAAGLLPKEEQHTHDITGVRWLMEAEALLLSRTTPENSSEASTIEPNDGLSSWPIDGQAKQ